MHQTDDIGECFAFCTAASYSLKSLFEFFRTSYPCESYRNALRVQLGSAEAFYFPFGTVVFWGLTRSQALSWIQETKSFENETLENTEEDAFFYTIGKQDKIVNDLITLSSEDPFIKLAVSHALAQSAKLSTFEDTVQKTFHSMRYVPEALATDGKISLSRRAIRRKMGALFLERSSITLHTDVLDTPEIFWEYPELEPPYRLAVNYLDLPARVQVLKERLTVIHELFEMLGNELNHQHSSRLEWIIILLIFFEVVVGFSRDVLRWM